MTGHPGPWLPSCVFPGWDRLLVNPLPQLPKRLCTLSSTLLEQVTSVQASGASSTHGLQEVLATLWSRNTISPFPIWGLLRITCGWLAPPLTCGRLALPLTCVSQVTHYAASSLLLGRCAGMTGAALLAGILLLYRT